MSWAWAQTHTVRLSLSLTSPSYFLIPFPSSLSLSIFYYFDSNFFVSFPLSLSPSLSLFVCLSVCLSRFLLPPIKFPPTFYILHSKFKDGQAKVAIQFKNILTNLTFKILIIPLEEKQAEM